MRNLIRWFTGIACVALTVGAAFAQSYPAKPIRLVVGFPPGGSNDVIARIVAPKMSEQLGQPVVVENRPGAATSIATAWVAKSPADGYTLLLIASSTAVQSALRSNLPYDLERDLTPVSMVAVGGFVLVVHPSVPARNVKELIALARSQPGKLTYGSPGVGSTNHLAGELFSMSAKVSMLHVPYKGSAETSVANASGELALSFPSIPAALPLLGSGRLRAIAVTSARRSSLMPQIPTLDEAGLPGYDYAGWLAICAPTGSPREIITRLNALLGKVVNTAEIREAIAKQGFEAQTGTPEQLAAHIRREIAKNVQLIARTGLKAE
jgi:tripartite-type tricarboxylate transporter receptor subunit TctC